MSNGLVLDDNGFTLSIGLSPFQGGDSLNGGLVKKGSGTVYLNAGNSYTGITVVTNGTLAGIGSVSGSVTVGPAANIGAGTAGAIGTFSINNGGIGGDLILQGNATLRVDKTGGTPLQPDQIALSGGNVTYGGTLTISNITTDASLLAIGDTFTLFTAPGFSGSFSAIQPAPGPSLMWSNDIVNRGNFIVVTNPVAPPVADFAALSATSIFAGQSVVFTNLSTGNITSSAWTFGDGHVANPSGATATTNVVNTYTTPGTYTVSLTVTGLGGSSNATKTAYVVVKPKTVIGKPVLSGGNLILSGTNGPIGQTYYILSSTNVALQLASWTPVYTNVFTPPDGGYSYTNSPQTNATSFFILSSPPQ